MLPKNSKLLHKRINSETQEEIYKIIKFMESEEEEQKATLPITKAISTGGGSGIYLRIIKTIERKGT